jgi:NADPH-dependent 2,4-dienoyl-CoA reductase/sulfur reductase-like enzyme
LQSLKSNQGNKKKYKVKHKHMKKTGFEDLKNRVCVITGGAGVLGTSMAEALCAAGVKTAVIDLNS